MIEWSRDDSGSIAGQTPVSYRARHTIEKNPNGICSQQISRMMMETGLTDGTALHELMKRGLVCRLGLRDHVP